MISAPSAAGNDSTNFAAFSTLIARRRPILICVGFCGSNAASVPSREDADQYRTASDPCCCRMSAGVTTLPFDFDIFLRSGSTMKPEIAASVHGARPSSSALRSIVEKSHVRMMSCPCGRRSNGATRFHSSSSRSQPPASCGVSDDVAQVSKMSSSGSKPPAAPR